MAEKVSDLRYPTAYVSEDTKGRNYMKASTDDLEVQLNAVLGFVLWLKSGPSQQTVEISEFMDQLLHVLRIYGWELNRRIDGEAATQDWLNTVAVTAILAKMLIDEFAETHPELAGYQSSDDPTTFDEMTLHLLSAAVDHFEMYSLPEALAPISDLVVVNAPTT
jgi:hypothetical protein